MGPFEDTLQLVVDHEHQGASYRPHGVGERALVQEGDSSLLQRVLQAAPGRGVQLVAPPAHHHHVTSDGVERISAQGREDVDGEGHSELGRHRSY
eukprot:758810-Hanusia_phi.AAC.1